MRAQTGRWLAFPALLAILVATHAFAQAPGTVCQTEQGWCWASVPGLPGDYCECVDPGGNVIPGTLR